MPSAFGTASQVRVAPASVLGPPPAPVPVPPPPLPAPSLPSRMSSRTALHSQAVVVAIDSKTSASSERIKAGIGKTGTESITTAPYVVPSQRADHYPRRGPHGGRDADAIVGGASMTVKRMDTVGEVVQYEDAYRLCYIRGPEGLLIGLAEELG